jgi:hypothetical protein
MNKPRPPEKAVPPAGSASGDVVPAPGPIRAGFGRVEAIAALPSSVQRLSIKMDDGTWQYHDTAASGLNIGQRVEFTRDGKFERR